VFNWLKKLWPGRSLMNIGANVGGYRPKNPTLGGTVGNPMASIGQVGYIRPGTAAQGYSGGVAQAGRPSIGMGKQSSWSDVMSGMDKDFWSALGGSMGSGAGVDGSIGAVNAGSDRQYKVEESKFLPVSPMAPNPGWERVLARKKQNRYSGAF
jgi:hypothetical protein